MGADADHWWSQNGFNWLRTGSFDTELICLDSDFIWFWVSQLCPFCLFGNYGVWIKDAAWHITMMIIDHFFVNGLWVQNLSPIVALPLTCHYFIAKEFIVLLITYIFLCLIFTSSEPSKKSSTRPPKNPCPIIRPARPRTSFTWKTNNSNFS